MHHQIEHAQSHQSLRSTTQSRARSQSQTQNDTLAHPVRNPLHKHTRRAQSTAVLAPTRTTTIEMLLTKPPTSLSESLKELKNLVLTQGVTADAEGNVESLWQEEMACN